MYKNEKVADVGVVVARLQVHELHEQHRNIINYVAKKHNKVIIFIGVSPVLYTKENPLDFLTRLSMVKEIAPNATILPLPDMESNDAWSANLDLMIKSIYSVESVCLYGGRDSFAKSYTGRFKVSNITEGVYSFDDISGTQIRTEVAGALPIESADYRAGVITATQKQYPRALSTVDMAVVKILDKNHFQILLGRKCNNTYWCFPGGFVDPEDNSHEMAAQRELIEETTLMVPEEEFVYIGSTKINDWRYTGTDRIITSLYLIDITSHAMPELKASDDLFELQWFDIVNKNYDYNTYLDSKHLNLLDKVRNYIKYKK